MVTSKNICSVRWTRMVLEGQGQEASLESQIKPLGSPDKYIEYLRAKAALQWNGQVPLITSGTSGANQNLIIPIPDTMLGTAATKK